MHFFPLDYITVTDKDSPGTVDDLVNNFGSLPAPTRQFVRHVVTLPDDAGHAYNAGGNIAMIGDTITNLNVYLHESAHSLDLLNAYGPTSLSGSGYWSDQYDQDEDVPDPYSQSNQVENVAQNTVVTSYERNVPGGFTGLNPDAGKIFHQWATVDTQQRNAGKLLIPGGSCTSRLADSDPVLVGGSKRSVRYRKIRLGRDILEGINEIKPVDVNTIGSCKKPHGGAGI